MEFLIKEQADILTVQNELMNILPSLKDKPYICEIKPYKKRRSHDANAYFHVLVDKIAKKLNQSADAIKQRLVLDYGAIETDENGVPYDVYLLSSIPVQQYFKYAKQIAKYNINGKEFIQYLIYKETHTLNSTEMATLIDGTITEAKELDIETLTPIELELIEGYKKEV